MIRGSSSTTHGTRSHSGRCRTHFHDREAFLSLSQQKVFTIMVLAGQKEHLAGLNLVRAADQGFKRGCARGGGTAFRSLWRLQAPAPHSSHRRRIGQDSIVRESQRGWLGNDGRDIVTGSPHPESLVSQAAGRESAVGPARSGSLGSRAE